MKTIGSRGIYHPRVSGPVRTGLVLAAIASVLTVRPFPARATVDFARPLKIHGPIILGPAELANLTPAIGSDAAQSEEPDAQKCAEVAGCTPSSPIGDGVLPQSPPADSNFLADYRNGAHDPGIAAGDSYVMVSGFSSPSINAVGVYDKAGILLPPKSNFAFPNPFKPASLFTPLLADIEAHVDYPPELPPGLNMGFGLMGDSRVLFDPFRKRFFIAALEQNYVVRDVIAAACVPANRPCTDKQEQLLDTVEQYPGLWLSWRQKMVVAVSRTQDPRDGFYLYWWDAVINDGGCLALEGCGNEPLFKPGTSNVDYPMIGIAERAFLASVGNGFVETDAQKAPAIEDDFESWWNCFRTKKTGKNPCHKRLYADLIVVPADVLAFPCLGSACIVPKGPPPMSFGIFLQDDGMLNDINARMNRVVRPVMHHSAVPAGGVFFTNPYVAPDTELGYFVYSRITFDPVTKEPTFSRHRVPVAKFDGLSDLGGSASYRDGLLHAVWQECRAWPGVAECLQSVHMVRVSPHRRILRPSDPPGFPGANASFIDRSFGLRNVYDDTATASRHYQFPAIEVNVSGDMVIVYARFADDLPQEVRFTVRYRNDPDVRPSRLLRAGKRLDRRGTDTAGIAVDFPFEDGIWMAHIYAEAAPQNWGIAFGKVLGDAYPDLSVSSIAVDAQSVAPGDTVRARGSVHNGGDGASDPAVVTVYLSRDAEITTADTPVGSVPLRRMASGEDARIDLTITIPNDMSAGDYYVGAVVAQDEGSTEYSTENNSSPVLESDPRLRVDRRT